MRSGIGSTRLKIELSPFMSLLVSGSQVGILSDPSVIFGSGLVVVVWVSAADVDIVG